MVRGRAPVGVIAVLAALGAFSACGTRLPDEAFVAPEPRGISALVAAPARPEPPRERGRRRRPPPPPVAGQHRRTDRWRR